jgi:hypothetical protein
MAQKKEEFKETVSVTFCECAENHHTMKKLGTKAVSGIPVDFLDKIAVSLREQLKGDAEIVELNDLLPEEERKNVERATVLVIRKGVQLLCGQKIADLIYSNILKLPRDKHMLSRGGKVFNKNARHNNIIADEDIDPCVEKGQGTVISFEHIEELKYLRKMLGIFNENLGNLYAETNYYYNPETTYIGFHGDTERRIVICARFGVDFPLYYQWYHKSNPIGKLYTTTLSHGDIYIMSDKAVGYDWKKQTILTLRHAAGAVPKMPSVKTKLNDNCCIAVKKDGETCTNKKKEGSDYCGIHLK